MPSKVYLWELLVPTIRRVGGKPYTTRFHRVWDAKVRAIAGGLTVLQPTKGQWVSPDGELFVERMIPVRIACTRDQVEAIADLTAAYYDQLAVMFYRVADEVVIKHYKETVSRAGTCIACGVRSDDNGVYRGLCPNGIRHKEN